ncbi:DMT family transporter [Bacillota bacterium Meth-B3]|nr:DMT family transporter [Christensenellaceae bacterium]
MHYALSTLAAVAISVMILINGELTRAYDLYAATVTIHVVGLVLVSAACALRGEKLSAARGLKWTAFLGGAVGVATTVFNNQAYGQIDVSAIVALNLVGQAGSALAIDQFALFGMKRAPMSAGKALGLLGAGAGIAYMLAGTACSPVPVGLSLLTGVTLTLNRYLNARLAARTSALVSTFYNYVVGLAVALVVWAIAGAGGASAWPTRLASPWWIYFGGAIGVLIVLQANISTRHIPAFLMTLTLFIGQLFAGVALDWSLAGALSTRNLVGGACVLAGLCVNVWMDIRRGRAG